MLAPLETPFDGARSKLREILDSSLDLQCHVVVMQAESSTTGFLYRSFAGYDR